jgi:hypothetical protein
MLLFNHPIISFYTRITQHTHTAYTYVAIA